MYRRINVKDAYYYVNYNFRLFQFYFIAIFSFRPVTPADRRAVEQVARALHDEFAKNIIATTTMMTMMIIIKI